MKYGYCPAGLVRKSVTRTLEYFWADHAISRLAEALGHTDDAALFRKHGAVLPGGLEPGHAVSSSRGTLRGSLVEPFKPLLADLLGPQGRIHQGLCRRQTRLQWRWGAPYDAEGLVALFKSRDYFVEQLDVFFAKTGPGLGVLELRAPTTGTATSPISTPLISFNAAGRPDLTQKWVCWVLDDKYGQLATTASTGNDDGGTISAWYVLSALGLYPVAGSDKYELGAPLFREGGSETEEQAPRDRGGELRPRTAFTPARCS